MKYKIVFSGSIFVFLLILLFGPGFYRKTSTPEYCSSCHVMENEFSMWYKTGLHKTIKCTECHLPHNNFINHLVRKGIDGLKDVVFFYGRLYDDNIIISDAGRKTVRKNCLRCHAEMVSAVNMENRNCWSCHRRAGHNFPLALSE